MFIRGAKAFFVSATIFILLISTFVGVIKADSGWLAGWSYRQSHTINYSGSLSNYQIYFNVYAGTGISSGNNVYLNNHCTSFPNDINFTDSSNNYYKCWMENSNSTWAKIWVKITSVPTTMYIYYGNPGQTSFKSNGDATFVFFDDFSSGNIDWTNKWYSTSQSLYSITNGQLKCAYGTSGQYIRTKNTFGDSGYCLSLKVNMSSSSAYVFYATYGDDNSTTQTYSFYYKNAGLAYWPSYSLSPPGGRLVYNSTTGRKTVPSTSGTGFTISANQWQLVNLQVNNATVNSNCTQGSILRASQSGSDAKFGYPRYIKFLSNVVSQYAFVDFVYLRRTVAGVSHGVWGGEEVSGQSSVGLNSPADGAAQATWSVAFEFTPVFYQPIKNASLWTNQTGSWARTQWNTTQVLNNTQNAISYTFGLKVRILWNVQVFSLTGSVFASANRTVIIQGLPTNTVGLNSPADGAAQATWSVAFEFTPVFYQPIKNASLWTNQTGSWARTQWNTTQVLNNTQNAISYTFSSEATFLWNVQVFNSTGSVFASANRAITIGLLNGWLYRKSLVISNSTGAGTNYQVKIQVNYNSSTTPPSWQPYYNLSPKWTTIVGNPTNQHGFDPVHKTNIVEVDKMVDGAVRKYLAYDSDPSGYQVNLFYTDNLDGNWTAYSGNPILSSASLEYRIPSVVFDGSTFHMFVNDLVTYTIRRFTSTDGINYVFQENVLTDTGYVYKAPFIWFNPNDNRWILYWLKVSGSNYMIAARNSTDITALAAAHDVIVWTETGDPHFSFQTVMYRDNAYWMLGESQPSGWVVRALKSTTSPTSGFVECSNSPILTNDEACPRQFLSPDGTKAYLFTNRNSGYWYQDTRQINSTFPSGPSQPPQLNTGGHCRTDFGDIRFADSNGLLSNWMQEKVDGNYATFWVKIPSDLGTLNATIFMYYGKSNAITTSNGDNTFVFFDDFPGTTLNSTKWISSGTVTVANSICTVSASSDAVSNTQTEVGYAVEALSKTNGASASLLFATKDLAHSAYNIIFPGTTTTQNASGQYTQTTGLTMANLQYHIYTIARVSNSKTMFYYDDNLLSTHTAHIDTGLEGAAMHGFPSGNNAYTDWIFMRKFVTNGPSVISWGTEEPAHPCYLNVAIVGQGSVSLNATGPYSKGSVVQLTAIPVSGWSFDHWSGDLTGSANPAAITMTSNRTVTAYFTGKPALNLVSIGNTCRKYNEQFSVRIDVSNISCVQGLEFEIHFNTTLLNYSSITWNAWGSGTVTVDEAGGKIIGSTSGTQKNGSQTLVTILFNATYYHIWKNEATIPDWTNDQTGTIFFQKANLTYPSNPTAYYVRGGSNNGINVGQDVTYKWSPIKGDVNLDGQVDINDLVVLANYYDATPANATLWSSASKYELTNPNSQQKIDIYDLIVIASNYGYAY